jgi:predicted phosphodiesterase
MDNPTKTLTFLHLSDIHFVRGFSGVSAYDVDEVVRNELVRDAKRLLPTLGSLDGILVTGDIAFAGKAEEYEIALKWLAEVSGALGCEPEYVWCVPGNHDVDQSILRTHTSLSPTHKEIRTSQNLDKTIRTHLESESTGPLLFSTLHNYNETFAARVGCVTTHKRPWWEEDLILNDGSVLRLRGLNSAIISGLEDDREKCKLCLGSAQTEYKRSDGVAYMTLCHHPPDWLVDGDNVRVALRAYSKIQLFGHKHMHDIEQVNGSLWICSGAVHPVRTEKQWNPIYYFLSIKVEKEERTRFLVVDVYRRIWDQGTRTFVRPAGQNQDAVNYRLPTEEWDGKQPVPAPAPASTEAVRTTLEQPPMTLNRKKLLYSFVGLPYHIRISIMQGLGLIDDTNRNLPDSELFASCFEKAVAKDLLERIWEAIETHRSAKSG